MRAEILAPAGSMDSLKAAVSAGADAVYIGGTRFGARAYADNLTQEQMIEAIHFCHLHQCKLYLTVNTLFKEKELEELYDYLLPYYEHGLDAVIVQDIGVVSYLRKTFPDLDIHASTQMTICGAEGAKLLESLGATRVVTSRELSLKELKTIRNAVSLEIESFVHGALCYCYSGQCLYSSLIGGRSGNRGRCAQPCRLPYQVGKTEGFLMSPKDIFTLDIIPDIIEAGVFSLKIEGRMKRPEYTAGVVRLYRKYLDQYLKKGRKGYRVSEEDKKELMALYNRGGFTEGYYQMRNGREMISLKRANHFGTEAAKVVQCQKGNIKVQALEELHKGDVLENTTLGQDVKKGSSFSVRLTPEDTRGLRNGQILHRTRDEQLIQYLNQNYVQQERKEKINGKLIISDGKAVILTVNWLNVSVTVTGEIPGLAKNQPLQIEKVKKQMEKTGNTPFVFEHLEIQMDDGLFLPLQSLNELRRNALEQLETGFLKQFSRTSSGKTETHSINEEEAWEGHQLCASVETLEQMEVLCEIPEMKDIYLDANSLKMPLERKEILSAMEKCHGAGKGYFYIMPHIFREDTRKQFEDGYSELLLFDGIIFKNYEEYWFLKEKGYDKEMIPDHNVYTFNQSARKFWKDQGMKRDTAPVELNDRELLRRGCRTSEIIAYGHLPMMVSAQCIAKTVKGCRKTPEVLSMRDRKGKEFPVKNHCSFCYNTVYNQVPLVLLENQKELDRLQPERLRLMFTIENMADTKKTAELYAGKFVRREGISGGFDDFTRGHFKRGVE